MLDLKKSSLEYSIDPDQVAFDSKPADQDPLSLKYTYQAKILQVYTVKPV